MGKTTYARAWHSVGDLGKVNLVVTMAVTEPIFVAVRGPFAVGWHHTLELLDTSLPWHFQVDADSAIQRQVGEVYIEVADSGFDDLGELLLRLLVVGDANLHSMLRGYEGSHTAGEPVLEVRWQFEESVDLPPCWYTMGTRGLSRPWFARLRGSVSQTSSLRRSLNDLCWD